MPGETANTARKKKGKLIYMQNYGYIDTLIIR